MIAAPYVSSTLRFSEQWWMRLGVRYVGTKSHLRQIDKTSMKIPEISMYNDAWLPILHTSYTPSSNHQITFSFNSSIDRPKFKDLNPFVWQINENSFYRGNTKLRPQLYYTTSLGYTFRGALSIRGRVRRGLGIITALSTLQGRQVYTQMENAQNSLFLGFEAGYVFRAPIASKNDVILQPFRGKSLRRSSSPRNRFPKNLRSTHQNEAP